MRTPPEIRTAGEADAADVGRILGGGFSDDPVMGWVLAEFADDVEARRTALVAMFGFIAREAGIGLGATDLLGNGCAFWTPPGSPEWPAERVEGFATTMRGVASDAALHRLGHMEAIMGANHPSEPHWYLGAIACLPESRGAGLGGMLLDRGLARVDAEHLPAYLESSNPRNVSLYERKGFATTDVVDLPDGGPPLTLMWRPAR